MVRIKRGVRLPPAVVIYRAAEQVYAELSAECVVTSGMEGQHMAGSRHYRGEALDFRTRHLSAAARSRLRQRMAELLGREYDVVLERTHLHVEYDPK